MRLKPTPDTAVLAGGGSANGLALRTPTQRLGLTVGHPAVGVRVVAVAGELDILTAPLFEACVREQLAAVPTDLILDLEAVRFLGTSGLSCLLRARELAQQSTGTQHRHSVPGGQSGWGDPLRLSTV